jgi:hypothetical protein
VFYTGLQYFPGHDTPIEMDLIILMDDRVLLVEIKDWTQKIRVEGDIWVVGRKSRRGNPAKLVAAKARKLKTLLSVAGRVTEALWRHLVLRGVALV